MSQKIVGQTKTAGFQIGVRRTFPIPQEKAWELVASADGLESWLGAGISVTLQPGQKYVSTAGAGEIRIVKPLQQLRLTWQKEAWQRPSTVQVRVIAKAVDKTTISFHQENLSDGKVREEMKEHWEAVLDRIREKIESDLSNE
ncbi:SRPBCC family protein [Brevibacillus borstelensis]|uniref:SRPBCC family protein n=1 Tax=Brevibacillus borstelensis TaxID=45462 RepID=UPI0030BD0946